MRITGRLKVSWCLYPDFMRIRIKTFAPGTGLNAFSLFRTKKRQNRKRK